MDRKIFFINRLLLCFIFLILLNLKLYGNNAGTELFKFGMNLYQNQKFVGAAKVFNSFLKKYPNSQFVEEAKYFLGGAMFQTHEYFKAEKILNDLFYNGNKLYLREETLYKLVNIEINLSNKKKYLELASLFRKKFPNSAYIEKLDLILKPNKSKKVYSEQNDTFEELAVKIQKKENISLDSAYYFLGLDLQQNDSYIKAEMLYREFLRKFNKSMWYYNVKYMLSLILIQKKKVEQAIINLKDIYLNSSENELKVNSLYLIAESFISTGNIDKAKKYYRIICDDYKDSKLSEDAYYMLGEILKKQGKEKESAGLFSKIAKIRNTSDKNSEKEISSKEIVKKLPAEITMKIKKLMKERNYIQAIKEIDIGRGTYGDKPEFYYLRGNIYQLLSRYKEAIKQYELYVNASKDKRVYSILGYLYYVIGDYRNSIKSYKKIIKEVKDSKRVRDAKYAIEKISKKI